MFSQDEKIQCPYCAEWIWLELDPVEDQNQSFVIDCEVCCRPLQVHSSSSGIQIVRDDSVGA